MLQLYRVFATKSREFWQIAPIHPPVELAKCIGATNAGKILVNQFIGLNRSIHLAATCSP
jgi:hypothetical protein